MALGQFVRVCVSTNVLSEVQLDELCNQGKLFALESKREFGEPFIDYFKFRGTALTVMSRARMLSKFCTFALDFGQR